MQEHPGRSALDEFQRTLLIDMTICKHILVICFGKVCPGLSIVDVGIRVICGDQFLGLFVECGQLLDALLLLGGRWHRAKQFTGFDGLDLGRDRNINAGVCFFLPFPEHIFGQNAQSDFEQSIGNVDTFQRQHGVFFSPVHRTSERDCAENLLGPSVVILCDVVAGVVVIATIVCFALPIIWNVLFNLGCVPGQLVFFVLDEEQDISDDLGAGIFLEGGIRQAKCPEQLHTDLVHGNEMPIVTPIQ